MSLAAQLYSNWQAKLRTPWAPSNAEGLTSSESEVAAAWAARWLMAQADPNWAKSTD